MFFDHMFFDLLAMLVSATQKVIPLMLRDVFGLFAAFVRVIPKQIISMLWHEGGPDIDNIELLIQQMTGE